MPKFDPDSPYNRECKYLHAGKVYWNRPNTLEESALCPPTRMNPAPPSQVRLHATAKHG